jgi:hypothetical protein
MKALCWAALLNAACVTTAWAACGDSLPAAGRQVLDRPGLQLAYAPQGGSMPLGRIFSLDIEVCAPADGAAPALRRVDADMPAHRHGMNYRSTLRTLEPGRYVAQGLMLHMPGRWRLIFELAAPPGQPVQRITQELTVE